MGIPLVIAESTGAYRRDLRRFTFTAHAGCGRDCPAGGGHDATVTLGQVTEAEHEAVHGDNWPHGDPRWPVACAACGEPFVDTDEWQRNDNRLYALPSGAEFTLWGRDPAAPPGTMVRIEHYDEFSRHPSGIESWLVILPDGGQWITSQAASGGGWWTVEGTPPLITVSPSIFHNQPTGWHGFIRAGELVPA